ncbi:uncharacterized protein ACR2FA_012199 [Aphomia sociella]
MYSNLTLIYLTIFILASVFGQHFKDIKSLNEKRVKIKYLRSDNDIISKEDLVDYLRALRHIIYFAHDFKNEIDLNFEFGLFLVNVNLKSVFEEKQNVLPTSLKKYLELLLKKNDELIEFFKTMVERDKNPQNQQNKMLASLFSNESQWIKELRDFDKATLKHIRLKSREELDELYSPWDDYVNKVGDLESGKPNPKISDFCMVSLASNPINHDRYMPRCRMPNVCHDMVANGTDIGYALVHRLLLLLHAKYARGCNVLSPTEDKNMRKRLCSTAYDEAQYIATQEYRVNDLMMEHICLCGLDGHAKYLQRSWLTSLLHFQSPYGCFGQSPYSTSQVQSNYQVLPKTKLNHVSKAWKLDKNMENDIAGGLCNTHVTSAAAATLAVAIRYILDHY